MFPDSCPHVRPTRTRREFIRDAFCGFGGLALASLLEQEQARAGTPDPMNHNLDACPLTSNPDNLVGRIITCPTYEADGKTMSPLAGQAVISNLYPGLYEVQAFPAADRIARGEEWLQTNTLDGGKPHEAFVRPGEPAYFQEFGTGGFHVMIGFANPKILT